MSPPERRDPRRDWDSWRDWIDGVAEAPPGEVDALVDADETEVSAIFADAVIRVSAAREAPRDVDAAAVRLMAALDAQSRRPKRRTRWWLAAAIAAGLLAVVVTQQSLSDAVDSPVMDSPATDPLAGVKGTSAISLEVDFLREDAAGGRRPLDAGDATTADRLVARARIGSDAWLYLVHRGPDGRVDVVPFADRALPAGVHVPAADGRVVAYDFDGEPGRHHFAVIASPDRRDSGLASSPAIAGEARVTRSVEVR